MSNLYFKKTDTLWLLVTRSGIRKWKKCNTLCTFNHRHSAAAPAISRKYQSFDPILKITEFLAEDSPNLSYKIGFQGGIFDIILNTKTLASLVVAKEYEKTLHCSAHNVQVQKSKSVGYFNIKKSFMKWHLSSNFENNDNKTFKSLWG